MKVDGKQVTMHIDEFVGLMTSSFEQGFKAAGDVIIETNMNPFVESVKTQISKAIIDETKPKS